MLWHHSFPSTVVTLVIVRMASEHESLHSQYWLSQCFLFRKITLISMASSLIRELQTYHLHPPATRHHESERERERDWPTLVRIPSHETPPRPWALNSPGVPFPRDLWGGSTRGRACKLGWVWKSLTWASPEWRLSPEWKLREQSNARQKRVHALSLLALARNVGRCFPPWDWRCQTAFPCCHNGCCGAQHQSRSLQSSFYPKMDASAGRQKSAAYSMARGRSQALHATPSSRTDASLDQSRVAFRRKKWNFKACWDVIWALFSELPNLPSLHSLIWVGRNVGDQTHPNLHPRTSVSAFTADDDLVDLPVYASLGGLWARWITAWRASPLQASSKSSWWGCCVQASIK